MDHRNIKDFPGMYSSVIGVAMRKVPAVAPLFGTFSSCLATLNGSFGQRPERGACLGQAGLTGRY
eukprot:365580-Chlamydomonas_euryale.AAC.15